MSGLKDSDYEFSEQQQQSLRLARQQEGLVRELQGIREQVHVAARGLSPGLRSSFPREVKTAEQWQLQVGAMEIAGGELAGNIDLLARHVSQGRATLTSLVAIASEHAPQLSRELGSRLAIFEATVTGQLHLLSQWHPPKKTTNHRQFIAIAHDQLARQEFTALGVQLTLQEKQLSEELEQADRQEEKQQKRLKLLAALRDVCRDLGFLELGAPEYESREERGSRIMFAVDTINRGIIHFALSLDSIQSESAIADNHCFDEFDQLSRDLEEKFSIRTKFRPADEQRPLGSRRGARELPGGAGQARQARA